MSLDKLRALIEAYNPASSQRTDASVKAHHDLALLARFHLLPLAEALEKIRSGEIPEAVKREGLFACLTFKETIAALALRKLEEALK